jgi:hypothetical protein
MTTSTTFSARFPRLARLLEWIGERWATLRNLGLALKPMRLSLLMVAAGVVYLFVDQGLDTLRYFSEYQGAHERVTMQRLFFLAGAILWVYGSWYWARVMTYLALDPAPRPTPGVHFLQAWMPRVAGALAIFSLALAFHRAGQSYADASNASAGILRGYMYFSLAGGVLYLVFVLTRRHLPGWLEYFSITASVGRALPAMSAVSQEEFGVKRISDLPLATWLWLAIPGAFALLLFGLFAWDAATFAPALGTVTILLLAASGWIALGSAVDLLGMRFRFPVFTLLLILAVAFSFRNDNHAVRTLDQPQAKAWSARDNVEAALREWFKYQTRYPAAGARTEYPLFIVAAEGGGIRAAYWTANVLTAIQDDNPCFAEQLFALSGVSGGSLGAAVFTALLADQHRNQPARRCDRDSMAPLATKAKGMLSEDFLAPAVAATLYPDLLQRILPVAIPRFDRARALETAWERAWYKHAGSQRFAEAFDGLWQNNEDRWLPALLLNATWVETGKRLIASNLRVQLLPEEKKLEKLSEFADAEDVHRFYGQRALPLSTAVHLSARFTYVSPAGTLVKDGRIHGRAVDGGYFENSGATSVLEILKVLDHLAEPGTGWAKVKPYVILISNEPVDLSNLDEQLDSAPDNKRIKPFPAGNEVLSPLLTMINTRGARGEYARVTTRWHVGQNQFLHFGLCRDGAIKIPLGWVLSGAVRDAMDEQLHSNACGPFTNQAHLDTIKQALHVRYARRR